VGERREREERERERERILYFNLAFIVAVDSNFIFRNVWTFQIFKYFCRKIF